MKQSTPPIELLREQLKVPKNIVKISKELKMFQPKKDSSFYRKPRKEKIPYEQRKWLNPHGTLRLSDHWNYRNRAKKMIYRTNAQIPKGIWVLAIHTSLFWKILRIFEKKDDVKNFNCREIEAEAKSLFWPQGISIES